MTKQEIFNRIIAHLYDQGAPAVNPSGGCYYLAPDGKRCAIGALIPDGHAGLDFIGPVYGLILNYPDLKSMIPKDDQDREEYWFLTDMQEIHDVDSYKPVADWRFSVRAKIHEMARKYNLTYKIPDNWGE